MNVTKLQHFFVPLQPFDKKGIPPYFSGKNGANNNYN